MNLSHPVLCVGIGGAGSKIAIKVKETLNSDILVISHDKQDLPADIESIEIPTESVINPSAQLLRGFTNKTLDKIESKISQYSSIVIIANLAGRGGAGIAPIVSNLCKNKEKNTVAFAIMPFKYEKNRIFQSGVALKRLQKDCKASIVLDNDAMLDSNPELTPEQCYQIGNSAILYTMSSINDSEIPNDTSILSTSKKNLELETSLRDSLKMLYEDAPAKSVKRTMLHVLGGNNVPAGMLNSITNMTSEMFAKHTTHVDIKTSASKESQVIMVSAVQGETIFEKYDPLGVIQDNLDWDEPDCIMDCKLDMYKLD